MGTDWQETRPEYSRRMADDGVGGLASDAQVIANIEASMAEIAQVVTDIGEVPSTASIRPAGSFTDAQDAKEYLDRGGLVVTDDAGNTQPIGFVYLLQMWDEVLEQMTWQVWIDDDTG